MKRILISDKFTFGKLIRYAVPSIIMLIFTSLYGVVDGLFVSNVVGDDAFTAVNLFMPVFYLFGALGTLLGSGGAALIAKLLGERRDEDARGFLSCLTILTVVTAAAITAVTVAFMPNIASALGAKGDVHTHCVRYGRIMLAGLTPFMLQFFFQYLFAVAERPKFGLVITLCAGATNMLGDFLLIYVAKAGVVGAAAATVVGECVGGIVPLVFFFRKKDNRLYYAKPKFEARTIGKVCVNGSSELLSAVSTSLVNMLYNFQLLKYIGNDGVVAFGIIMYVSFIFVGCYMGFSVGTAPIVGYNYGAQNSEELKSVLKKSLIFIGAASGVLTVAAEALAKPLAMIFVNYDKQLLELTVRAIRIFSLSFLLSGFNIYASAFFTALNNGVVSAAISVSRTLVFQIGAVLLVPLAFGLNGIWSATIVAEALSLVISVVMLTTLKKRYRY